MILILIAIALLLVVSFILLDRDNYFLSFLGVVGISLGFFSLFSYLFLAFSYFAADHKKEIINREYGTNYTQEEVFYASDVIDTVRKLNRSRVEVNGDILKNK